MSAKSYTGATTAGTALDANPCTVQALTFNPAAGAVVTIYNNASAASGPILYQATFAAAGVQGVSFTGMGGLAATSGLFLVVATAACQVTANVS